MEQSDGRFLTLAETVRGYVTGQYTDGHHAHHDKAGFSRRIMIAGVAGTGALAVAGLAAWELLKPAPANRRALPCCRSPTYPAILDQAYFSDGIAEELRSAYARRHAGHRPNVFGSRQGHGREGRRGEARCRQHLDWQRPPLARDDPDRCGASEREGRPAKVGADLDRVPGDAIKIQTDIAENVALGTNVDWAGGARR